MGQNKEIRKTALTGLWRSFDRAAAKVDFKASLVKGSEAAAEFKADRQAAEGFPSYRKILFKGSRGIPGSARINSNKKNLLPLRSVKYPLANVKSRLRGVNRFVLLNGEIFASQM